MIALPPGAIAIRPARPDDAEELSRVIVGTLQVSNAAEYPPPVIARVSAGFSPEAVTRMIAARRVLVASREDRIVGTASLDGSAVRGVFVLPVAQRLGIGGRLMAEILQMARDIGHDALTLQSSLGAVRFYERLGFAAAGEHLHGEERTVVMTARPPFGGPSPRGR